MSTMKLHTYPNNPNAMKTLIAAKYSGVEVETVGVEMGVSNKTPEFLAMNPIGKVPVLETEEGAIFESNAMAEYVAKMGDAPLIPKSAIHQGQMAGWVAFSNNEVQLPTTCWVLPILGFMPYNKQVVDKAKADLTRAFGAMELHLRKQTFFVGQRMSLADITLAVNCKALFTIAAGKEYRKQFPNVMRWFNTVMAQEEVAAVTGPVKLIEANGKPPKKEKAKKEAKKEEPKPAAAAAAKKEKKVNPLDKLPKSSFDLNGWKRAYSNAGEKIQAILPADFWGKLDQEGWSLWFCDYKYNDEIEYAYRSCNLIGGWFGRSELCRKYAFASVVVTDNVEGAATKHSLKGCWLFRGQDMLPMMLDVDDSELFDWRKADLTNEADKKLVENFWTWEGDLNGGTVNDGKIFK